MLDEMLPHISLLGESLLAEFTSEWPNSKMHPDMVKKIPSSHESFPTILIFTTVHNYHLSILFVLLKDAFVRITFQGIQILNVRL